MLSVYILFSVMLSSYYRTVMHVEGVEGQGINGPAFALWLAHYFGRADGPLNKALVRARLHYWSPDLTGPVPLRN